MIAFGRSASSRDTAHEYLAFWSAQPERVRTSMLFVRLCAVVCLSHNIAFTWNRSFFPSRFNPSFFTYTQFPA